MGGCQESGQSVPPWSTIAKLSSSQMVEHKETHMRQSSQVDGGCTSPVESIVGI